VTYRARITENAAIQLEDGREFASPSIAAKEAASIPASDGWFAWRLERREGLLLNELRKELAQRESANSAS
jgi:hypothetical protein